MTDNRAMWFLSTETLKTMKTELEGKTVTDSELAVVVADAIEAIEAILEAREE